MIYIDIKIGKKQHYFAVTNSDGEVLTKPTFYNTNATSFDLLLEVIKPFRATRLWTGYESTGHYGDNLGRFLLEMVLR